MFVAFRGQGPLDSFLITRATVIAVIFTEGKAIENIQLPFYSTKRTTCSKVIIGHCDLHLMCL